MSLFRSESAKKGDIEGVKASKPPPKNAGELRPMTPGLVYEQYDYSYESTRYMKIASIQVAFGCIVLLLSALIRPESCGVVENTVASCHSG